MSPFWTLVGDLIPATWGVEGFIRLNSNNASLIQNSTPYLMMWLLAAIYFVTAVTLRYVTLRTGNPRRNGYEKLYS